MKHLRECCEVLFVILSSDLIMSSSNDHEKREEGVGPILHTAGYATTLC